MVASTLNMFCSVVYRVCPLSNYRSTLLWLIFLKLVVPALRRGEYSQDDNFVTDEWSLLSRSEQHISSSPSVVTPVHLRLWCTSPLATEKQWLSIILPATLRNIIYLLRNEVKFYLLHKACRQGRWHRVTIFLTSASQMLISMASAHKWRLIIYIKYQSINTDTKPVWPQSDISPVISFWERLLGEQRLVL